MVLYQHCTDNRTVKNGNFFDFATIVGTLLLFTKQNNKQAKKQNKTKKENSYRIETLYNN